MAKFFVVQGSVGLPKKDPGTGTPKEFWPANSAGIGEAVELTPEQAAPLLAQGFIADEKTFAGLKQMIAGAAKAGTTPPHQWRKLAAALASK